METDPAIHKDSKPFVDVNLAHSDTAYSAYGSDVNSNPKNASKNEKDNPYSLLELLVIFVLFSFPLLFYIFLLLGLMLWSHARKSPEAPPPSDQVGLPGSTMQPGYFYLSEESLSGSLIGLVGSTGPTICVFVMPWFLIIYSYIVAHNALASQSCAAAIVNNAEASNLIHSLLKGSYLDLLAWFWSPQRRKGGESSPRAALNTAARGLAVTWLFVLLFKGAEVWLSYTAQLVPNFPIFYKPCGEGTASECESNQMSGFDFDPTYCTPLQLQNPTPDSFAPSDELPCSMKDDLGLTQLVNSDIAYQTLDSGIPDITTLTGNFSEQNFDNFFKKLVDGRNAGFEVVIYQDNKTDLVHAMYVDIIAGLRLFPDVVIDFSANTTSMSTTCKPITSDCQLNKAADSDSRNMSVPFNCFDTFSGDLNIPPNDGMQRFAGWYSSFYAVPPNDTRAHNVSLISAINPFTYNITALVSSESLATYSTYTHSPSEADQTLVDAGHERIAFALSCTSTIYDVRYSLLNGVIDWSTFTATPSDPRKAAVIKAPLQVGFGRHELFSRATSAVLDTNYTVEQNMGMAFSQIGLALVSGVFTWTNNTVQRERSEIIAMKVPKAPLWVLIGLCSVYIVLGSVYFFLALKLRNDESQSMGLEEVQLHLLPKVPIVPRCGSVNKIWKRSTESLLDQ